MGKDVNPGIRGTHARRRSLTRMVVGSYPQAAIRREYLVLLGGPFRISQSAASLRWLNLTLALGVARLALLLR